MKLQILTIAVIALVALLPFVSAAMQRGNEILPVVGEGKGEMTREQLKEKFLGEEAFRAELKNQIQNCVDDESTECEGVRAKVRAVVKGIIGKTCQNTETIMEKMRTRIQNSPKLTDEEKETLIKVTNEQETKLQGLCEGIEDMDDTELKERTREMKQAMKEARVKFQLAKTLIHTKRVGLVIERAEHLETKLESFIEKWNVTNCSIEDLTEQFNAKIAEAREAYDESVDLWQQFKESVQNGEPDTELLRQAQDKKQEAQLKLKEAHVILKDIIVELRECRGLEEVESE